MSSARPLHRQPHGTITRRPPRRRTRLVLAAALTASTSMSAISPPASADVSDLTVNSASVTCDATTATWSVVVVNAGEPIDVVVARRAGPQSVSVVEVDDQYVASVTASLHQIARLTVSAEGQVLYDTGERYATATECDLPVPPVAAVSADLGWTCTATESTATLSLSNPGPLLPLELVADVADSLSSEPYALGATGSRSLGVPFGTTVRFYGIDEFGRSVFDTDTEVAWAHDCGRPVRYGADLRLQPVCIGGAAHVEIVVDNIGDATARLRVDATIGGTSLPAVEVEPPAQDSTTITHPVQSGDEVTARVVGSSTGAPVGTNDDVDVQRALVVDPSVCATAPTTPTTEPATTDAPTTTLSSAPTSTPSGTPTTAPTGGAGGPSAGSGSTAEPDGTDLPSGSVPIASDTPSGPIPVATGALPVTGPSTTTSTALAALAASIVGLLLVRVRRPRRAGAGTDHPA